MGKAGIWSALEGNWQTGLRLWAAGPMLSTGNYCGGLKGDERSNFTGVSGQLFVFLRNDLLLKATAHVRFLCAGVGLGRRWRMRKKIGGKGGGREETNRLKL